MTIVPVNARAGVDHHQAQDEQELEFMQGGIPAELALEIFKHLSPEDMARLSQTSKFWNAVVHLDWSNFCGKRMPKIFYCVPKVAQVVKRVLNFERRLGSFKEVMGVQATKARKDALVRVERRTELALREEMIALLEGYPAEIIQGANQILEEILKSYCTKSATERSQEVSAFTTLLMTSSSESHRSVADIFQGIREVMVELKTLKADLALQEPDSEEAVRLNAEIEQKEHSLNLLKKEMETNPAFMFSERLSTILLGVQGINSGEATHLRDHLTTASRAGIQSPAKKAFVKKMHALQALLESGKDLSADPESLKSIEETLDLILEILARGVDLDSDESLKDGMMAFLNSFANRPGDDIKAAFHHKMLEYSFLMDMLESTENRNFIQTAMLSALHAIFGPAPEATLASDESNRKAIVVFVLATLALIRIAGMFL